MQCRILTNTRGGRWRSFNTALHLSLDLVLDRDGTTVSLVLDIGSLLINDSPGEVEKEKVDDFLVL